MKGTYIERERENTYIFISILCEERDTQHKCQKSSDICQYSSTPFPRTTITPPLKIVGEAHKVAKAVNDHAIQEPTRPRMYEARIHAKDARVHDLYARLHDYIPTICARTVVEEKTHAAVVEVGEGKVHEGVGGVMGHAVSKHNFLHKGRNNVVPEGAQCQRDRVQVLCE